MALALSCRLCFFDSLDYDARIGTVQSDPIQIIDFFAARRKSSQPITNSN